MNHEVDALRKRYARRPATDRYSMLKPDVWLSVQARQRAMIDLFLRLGWSDLSTLRLFEVGCGDGGNLLELLRLGFSPPHLAGAELIADRFAHARAALPAAVDLHFGDATLTQLAAGSQDVVLAATVFSSLLDDAAQQRLADTMWNWVRPGGGVLWYDFTIDNPANPDVRGVPLERLRELFPHGRFQHRRVTLAPPIARAVTRLHPSLYTLFNTVPMLRTHLLAWIGKR